MAVERPHSMTVRADQFALLDLGEDASPAVPRDQPAHVSILRASRQMVPVHRRMMKRPAAVGARGRPLQIDVPTYERLICGALPCKADLASSRVVLGVVGATALLAPRLAPMLAAPVKRAHRLALVAPRTVPCIEHMFVLYTAVSRSTRRTSHRVGMRAHVRAATTNRSIALTPCARAPTTRPVRPSRSTCGSEISHGRGWPRWRMGRLRVGRHARGAPVVAAPSTPFRRTCVGTVRPHQQAA